MDRDHIRASDGDRQVVLDQLREAAQDGRLDMVEYQERMEAALQARVFSELDVLVADLRRLTPPGQPQVTRMRDPFSHQRDSDGSQERGKRLRLIGTGALAAVGISAGLIFIWPEVLVYIVVGVLVVLVLFIVAAVLGLF
ncbi:DUF1707 SHOCT-like domain-containing protein [Haloglycomyces albus]|uniref:DUF1707 SHOCT-like domain-containing protein n=1 Tax=Haloglycomyces albus TaxID=526067 RepID=UPI00068561B7|nr:DUF1707 domain-containing protein [Haloglycomyces albus]